MPTTSEFESNLKELINAHSVENQSNTPDFILAKYLQGCLNSYNEAITQRDKWFNVDMWADDKIAKTNN